jgi:hypothetical protein
VNARHCGICGWASRDGTDLPGWCGRCAGRTVADVADLPELWGTLAAVLMPGKAGEQQRVGGSRTPPLPLRVDIASLRGPAQVGLIAGADQHGQLSIATVLWITRQTIRDVCDLPAEMHGHQRRDTRTGIERDATFVKAWLDRYAAKADPDELAHIVGAIQDVRAKAWGACGYNAHKVMLGPCPKQWEPGLACGNELWADPVLDDSVRCRDCGSLWDRKYFLWLRRHQETEVGA